MRRIASALLVALVVLSATETSYAFFRCRSMGVVVRACCCPARAESGPAERGPVVSADSCCDRGTVDVSRAPSEAARATTGDVGFCAVTTIGLPGGAASLAIHAARSPATRPPPWRPSLTLLKSSFLI